ncbi:receptor tyrosine-protein kinase let-23-like [Branchiostoma floridae]|uniref:receptor protein-tyrosine kinase n=1 Tax=Branchiostoma floridae TaxID=7739 RepID=A0A9J7MI51_BRAFL|nr:receptor tyrosine-protein kinase let-23-like [Branchiostoma floridae]
MTRHGTFSAALLLVVLLSGLHAYQELFVLVENVAIPEDVSVGSTVVQLRDFLNASVGSAQGGNGAFWSVNITTGDDSGRFGVRAEDLALILAAPLDYKFHSRYNLTVELTNTTYRTVLYVIIVIEVIDVPGYPPFYDKRCEAPVLLGIQRGGYYTVLSSDGIQVSIGDQFLSYRDYLKTSRKYARNFPSNFLLKDDCSARIAITGSEWDSDSTTLFSLLQGPQQGRLQLKCHDRERKDKGKISFFDISLNEDYPQWLRSGHFQIDKGDRNVITIELNDIWSTSPYWVRCSANIALNGGTNQLVYTFQYNVTGCPEGRYGLYCDKDCVCKNGARCHGFNGACKCRPGWRGRACDIPWPEVVIVETPGDSVVKYIDTNLTLTCLAANIHVANMTWAYQIGNRQNDTKVIEEGNVQNSSFSFQTILESDNGRYSCLVQAKDEQLFNATYVLNATECRPNYHGEVCSQVCDCEYGGTCDRWEGCLCPPGRHGDRCEHKCAPGTFGFNCSLECKCENDASCDSVNGSCICAEGQSGEFCQNVSIPDENRVVVVVLASVIPTIALIGCIVTGILVRRGRRRPEHPAEDLNMIETLSPWEVDKEDIQFEHMIGEGEFGHVVRGKLRVPEGYQVLVAAKSIRPERMTASAVRDFRREMDILARIHEDKEGHPNVVKLYGVVTKSEPQYILVEYASNEELRRYLWSLREHYKTTGNSKLLERLGFACDVACGLSELARLKIVHRDVAARNIVISDRKVAKIADFGLSRDIYVSSAYKRTNQGGEEELLPLKWMALESLRDGVYTCESDVWSYGVLLWEIASFGEEPRYAGGPLHPDVCTLLELLKKGVRLQQPENCPLSVYRIIRSCWIVDPTKRPTPEELFRKMDQMRPQRHAALLENHNRR